MTTDQTTDPRREAAAWLVRVDSMPRQPVKARGRHPNPREYVYLASEGDRAMETARILHGECVPLYAAADAAAPAVPPRGGPSLLAQCEVCADHNPEGSCFSPSDVRLIRWQWLCDNCALDGIGATRDEWNNAPTAASWPTVAPAVAAPAPGEYADLVVRLNRERISAPGINGERRMVPLNPDGPEAADAIERLVRERDAGGDAPAVAATAPTEYADLVERARATAADWDTGDCRMIRELIDAIARLTARAEQAERENERLLANRDHHASKRADATARATTAERERGRFAELYAREAHAKMAASEAAAAAQARERELIDDLNRLKTSETRWVARAEQAEQLVEALQALRERWNSKWADAFHDLQAAIARAETAERALTVAREALAYYADPQIYQPHPHGLAFDDRDKSFSARSALAAITAPAPAQEDAP